jgi:hypothetical protein
MPINWMQFNVQYFESEDAKDYRDAEKIVCCDASPDIPCLCHLSLMSISEFVIS